MAPVAMMKVAAEHKFIDMHDHEDADDEVDQILSRQQQEPPEPIESRIPPEYFMYRSHHVYPMEDEHQYEIISGVDGTWKTVIFPSRCPGTTEEASPLLRRADDMHG